MRVALSVAAAVLTILILSILFHALGWNSNSLLIIPIIVGVAVGILLWRKMPWKYGEKP